MTQKVSSPALPDGQQSSDAPAGKVKKPGTSARKTPARAKTASESAVPAEKAPAKSTAKTEAKTVKTETGPDISPKAEPAAKKPAKTPARAARAKTGEKDAAKAEAPVSAPVDGVEKPKASRPRRAATPKATATETADAPAKSARQGSAPETPAAEPKAREKKPRTARQARKTPEPALSETPNTAQAKAKTPDAGTAAAGAEEPKSPKPAAAKESVPAKPVAVEAPRSAAAEAAGPASEAPARETVEPPSSLPVQEQPLGQTQPQTQDQDAPPKPSRRSRRGGRRRNKNRNANGAAPVVETGTAPQAVEIGAATLAAGTEQAETEPAKEPGTEPAAPAGKKTPDARKKPEAKAPGKGGESGKGGGKRDSRKDSGKRDSGKTGTKADAKADVKADAKVDAKPEDGKNARRKMFISVLSGELVEVVLAEEGQVVEYYVEMHHQAKVKGNIYKGVVSNIDANLQAAFISYAGGVKNGFLQIDEVHPEYYLTHHEPAKGRKFPPIQKVLKPGQEILVQVVKEPSGTKGAFLTSYLSLPGRFLVLTPGREQIGVSRKVDSDEERTRLRGMLEGLTPGKGLGVIVRTVSEGASKTSLQRDLQFLKRLWKDVRTKGQTHSAPSLIYEELDLSTRAVRDYLTDDVQEVWVDDASTAGQVTELASLLFPKKQNLVQVPPDNGQTLFERFSLQKQLDQIHSREVALPSGGRLVIDNTEALTAIDINSGRSSGKSNFEDMAFRTNLEAARAIPLQLRLRDIGGQVVADFIEMRDRDHWREVEKAVRNGMKGDRARYDVGKIGPFGLLEIVRQRLGSSAISVSTEPCPCCKGTGIRRNMEWQSMQCLREIGRQLRHAAANNQASLTYEAEAELAFHILNAKRTILRSMEEEAGIHVIIRPAG